MRHPEFGSRDNAYLKKGVKGIAWMENGELFTTGERPPMKDLDGYRCRPTTSWTPSATA